MTAFKLRGRLDSDTIVDLAGPSSFHRGVEYAEDGQVGTITETDDAIEATVFGSEPYSTRIVADGEGIAGTCSCPMGDVGEFCKHCVALALVWLEPTPASATEVSPDDPVTDPVDGYLADLDRASLISLIKAEMVRDEALDSRIRLRAATDSEDGARTLRAALERATTIGDYLEYREVPAFARELEEIADAISGLIAAGHAEAAIDLAEMGLQRVEATIQVADDSDGYLGDLLRHFEEIHLEACQAAKPDAVELAQRLFHWEVVGDLDVFSGAAERYADVLGPSGLAEYRSLANERWSKVPQRGPGEDRYREEVAHSFGEYTVTNMMESLARASGDIDELIAVLSRDLSSSYRFLRVAEVCRDAGRTDEAIGWAERGLAAFPGRADVRLREFLADVYLDLSRDDDAMALIWAEFDEQPYLAAYQRLKRYAERTNRWDDSRPRALETVRRRAPDGTTLVAIHTWEDEIDAAWDAAHELGCQQRTLLELAKRSEDARPKDALAVFKAEVSEVLQVAGRRNYDQAMGLLRRIQRIMVRLDQTEEFRLYATEIRAANYRRPTFCSMFDSAGSDE